MNPEFQRNLWLELPPHRLIAMPAVLMPVFFAAWLASDTKSLSGTAQVVIALLLVVWGSRLAGESVLNEVIGRSWDYQRMSVISPWEMTWGKLLGSTAFVWYGAAWCIVVFLASPHNGLGQLVRLLLMGLQAQALALTLSLVLIRGEPANLRFQGTVAQSITLAGLLPFLFFELFLAPVTMHWYGMTYSTIYFMTFFQILFIGWTIFGLFQMMRAELQYSIGPISWLAFVVFCVSYFAGFDAIRDIALRLGISNPAIARLFVAFCTGVGLTYICALLEGKSLNRLFRWIVMMHKGRIVDVARLSPTWIGAFLVAFVLCLLTWINLFGLTPAGGSVPLASLSLVGAILLFLIRDLAIIHYLALHGRSGRDTLLIFLYLVTAYFLLPILISSIRLEILLPCLLPIPSASPLVIVLPVLIEAILAVVLLLQRWQIVRIESLEAAANVSS